MVYGAGAAPRERLIAAGCRNPLTAKELGMKTTNGSSVILGALLAVSGVFWSAGAATAASLDGEGTALRLPMVCWAALNGLYAKYPSAVTLSKSAKAIVVFPSITKAGLGIGAESGNGVMRVKGKTTGYYNTSGISSGVLDRCRPSAW